MRRFIAVLLCVFLLATPVYAANAVASAGSTASVSPNGSCQVTLTATIRLDTPVSDLTFPLGQDVSGVSLNGRNVSVKKDGGVSYISLSYLKNQVGSFPITIHYTLNNVVTTEQSDEDDQPGKQTVTIPLLYGFSYPVESMSFSVTMPGEFQASPVFLSGYHEQDIERSIEYSVTGTLISGRVTAPLKDSETLFMTLAAPEGMFPQQQAAGSSLAVDAWGMGICVVLSCIFWLLTMSHWPNFPTYRSTPPDGISAGVVDSYLTRSPADLTMMVIHWAQLGYLILHLDDNGRVILHKKMDMGNERGGFERRVFKNLFSKSPMLDATGYRYARLYEATARSSLRFSAGYRKDSGSPLLLRILATSGSAFAGVAMGDCVTTSPAWRVIWMMLLGILYTLGSWQIQKGMHCLRRFDRSDLMIGGICAGAMAGASLLIPGAAVYGLAGLAWSILAGLMAAFGGRRNENGQRTCSDLAGLRRYMRKVSKAELTRILRSNPNYYFELAPFAIALGVDRKFAKQFGSLRIPACGWLAAGMHTPQTPEEWYPLLREAVRKMNALAKRPFWEKYYDR